MDWFNPEEDAAAKQAQALNRALKMGGRVLLRSASIDPWYIKDFEANGFTPRRVGARFPGTCIDRLVFTYPYLCSHTNLVYSVNMYASAWVITKTSDVDGNTRPRSELGERSSSVEMETLTL